jgi:AcrR family transcriptional regulator
MPQRPSRPAPSAKRTRADRTGDGAPAGAGAGRPLRADARRNRARVLEVAFEVFATEGLAVPIHEIARRAGVGTGTVSRHFPTKEALFEAIVRSRVDSLLDRARTLAGAADPGAAFFEFFAAMVEEGAANRGIAESIAGAGFDIEAVTSGPEHDVLGALGDLLARAQRAGAVRSDVDTADVKALIVGCLARERTAADAAARDRMIVVVCEGLRASN